VLDRIIAGYGRSLQWVLRRQRATLVVTGGTLALTVALLFLLIPKGFFPLQDTGVILGITEGPQAVSFGTMGERQQALARVILEEPAVESLSSFIGVDGTNTHAQQRADVYQSEAAGERMAGAGEIIRRIEARVAEVDGITLHCSRCRISPWKIASAGPSFNTRWKTPILRN
jgi:multidrug efflux pump